MKTVYNLYMIISATYACIFSVERRKIHLSTQKKQGVLLISSSLVTREGPLTASDTMLFDPISPEV